VTDAFSVDVAALREVAARLNGTADETGELAAAARQADVPSGSWGLLGAELGLPDLYAEVRGQAESGLARIHEFLAWAGHNLTETAGDYEEHDRSTARTFAGLHEPPGTAPS
jgi:hypothetical protein